MPGDYPVAGDWDGNGTTTIGIYRNATFYLRNSNSGGIANLSFAFGAAGDQPIAGDWNGDGLDTIGIYRPSTGQFQLRNSNTPGTADLSFYLGNAGDVGIAGDWNGDGIDTIGVFRPSTGYFYLKNSNTTGNADLVFSYGVSGDKPLAGDWNNDGMDTIGLYRDNTFYLRNSNSQGFADLVFAFGNTGDLPIAGNWDGAPTQLSMTSSNECILNSDSGLLDPGLSESSANLETLDIDSSSSGCDVYLSEEAALEMGISVENQAIFNELPTLTPTPTATPVMSDKNNSANYVFVNYLLDPETPTPTLTPTPTATSAPTFTFTPTSVPSGPVTIDYIYDPLKRLKEANYSNGDYYHYTYDAVGNRKTQTTSIGGLTSTINYTYDHANRLIDVDGMTYTWDNNGNLLNDGVNTYTYDSANRLKTMTGASTTASYTYNGLGDRLQETVNGVTTTFTMDLNTGLTQALSDGTNNYIYGNGRIAQTHDTTTEYFLDDALGSVRQLTSGSGAITYARTYDPYGVVTQTSGASQTTYGYTGEFTSNDMVYLRSRMYSPGTGRFITRDTWGGDINIPATLNRWIYVEANPVNYLDPSGHITEKQANSANLISEKISKMFNVRVLKDWGYLPTNINQIISSALDMSSSINANCQWQEGRWDLMELETVLSGLEDLNSQRVMNGQFQKFLGPIIVMKSDFSACGADFRGCVAPMGSVVAFKDAGSPPTSVDISNSATIDKWTVVHEFGHAWDRNYGWTLSNQMMEYTGSYYNYPASKIKRMLGNCDYVDKNNHDRFPGCNDTGYYYQGKPPKGSSSTFNHREDFAEAVAAYVYPGRAEQRVLGYQNTIYEDLFYYEHYSDTQRYQFIHGLLSK